MPPPYAFPYCRRFDRDQLQRTTPRIRESLPNLMERFKKVVDDLARMSRYEIETARGILSAMVGGSIVLYPAADGSERYFTAEVSGDYAG